MKCVEREIWLLIVQLLVVKLSSAESDLEDSQAEGSSKQQGSWSQWWSYDGISGPDYWNINKQWRLCSLGRKQSPIEIKTDRLVYDHLLDSLHLNWLPPSATNFDDATIQKVTFINSRKKQEEKQTSSIRLRLLNSGRGIEAWFEQGLSWAPSRASSQLQQQQQTSFGQQEQLILSRGPLSYAYKLFKIELHSAVGSGTTTSGELTQLDSAGSGLNAADLQQQQQLLGLSSSSRSSEHLIDGRSFDGELQLHFYNKHLASSAIEALQLANEDSRPNLFATISVFLILETPQARKRYQQLKQTKDLATNKSAIDFILDNLSNIQNQEEFIELQLAKDQIESLITSKRHYVTYQGSMNRPPCAETVDWILLNKALRVDGTKFGGLFEKLNTNQENIRPIKPLNRRLLRTTINLDDTTHSVNSKTNNEEEDEAESDIEQKVSCSNVGGNKQCNSTNKLDLNGQRQVEMAKHRKGFGSCSMKPNYVYQLRFK